MAQALPHDFEPIPIAVQDELWLTMDRPTNLMIIDSLVWLEQAPKWPALRAIIRDRMVDRYPVFRCHPQEIDGRMHWVADADFRLARHVRKAKLGAPVDEESVRRLVAAERSKAFDRNHPLWSVQLIEAVHRADGRIGAAVLLRVHHSLADGIRMTELALGLCDPVDAAPGTISAKVGRTLPRAGRPTPALALEAMSSLTGSGASRLASAAAGIAEVGRSAGGALVRDLQDPLGAPGRAASSVADLAATAAREVVALVADPARAIDLPTYVAGLAPGGEQAANTVTEILGSISAKNPKSTWTGTPGLEKSVAWSAPIPLADIVQMARSCDATVNDALVAAVAGALMRYLAEHGTTLNEVSWHIPVSLQPFGDGLPDRLGNHLALVSFRMPLNLRDPKRRMKEVHRRTERIKNSQETLVTFGIQRVIAQSPHALSVMLTDYFANLTVGVLTNVPGPRRPVALAGARVDSMLGWAPCNGNQPMTVCIYSYAGQVVVSIAADAGLVPDLDRVTAHLDAEIEHMRFALGAD
ncbi:DUF1298 domain-containing protein [Yimella sp. cx-573]|nr:DUF1298 domain-containing protein [Yimella sp. cx-573]